MSPNEAVTYTFAVEPELSSTVGPKHVQPVKISNHRDQINVILTQMQADRHANSDIFSLPKWQPQVWTQYSMELSLNNIILAEKSKRKNTQQKKKAFKHISENWKLTKGYLLCAKTPAHAEQPASLYLLNKYAGSEHIFASLTLFFPITIFPEHEDQTTGLMT